MEVLLPGQATTIKTSSPHRRPASPNTQTLDPVTTTKARK